VDLNADGHIDVLSGSYAVRDGKTSAGYFHILPGDAKGTFGTAVVVTGTNGAPLTIDGEPPVNYCTRPTAVDLNGAGKVDIVAGNFMGNFALFLGQGDGKFTPGHTWLANQQGERLSVGGKGDPTFVDWDGDGDLDLISGSDAGDVHLFVNEGSTTEPKFGGNQKLWTRAAETTAKTTSGLSTLQTPTIQLGDAHLTRPQGNTRVAVGDVNGDGKLDLLIGDQEIRYRPAEGLSDAECHEKLDAWNKRTVELRAATMAATKAKRAGADRAQSDLDSIERKMRQHRRDYNKIVRTERAGWVWVMLRK